MAEPVPSPRSVDQRPYDLDGIQLLGYRYAIPVLEFLASQGANGAIRQEITRRAIETANPKSAGDLLEKLTTRGWIFRDSTLRYYIQNEGHQALEFAYGSTAMQPLVAPPSSPISPPGSSKPKAQLTETPK